MKDFFMRLKRDNQGIVLAGIIAITFIVLSSVIWLVLALVVNRVFDALYPLLILCDAQALAASENALNAFGVGIVFVDIGLLVWWGLSAQKYGSQEEPMIYE